MRYKLFFTILSYIFIFPNSFAISYSWFGATNSDWATPTNWSPNGIPGPGDDITIGFAINPCQVRCQ